MNPMNGLPRTHAILLVEDNEDDYLLVDSFLSGSEYQLIWCNTASKARERLASEQFDLVLLDHGLPDSNGLSFLEEIRASFPATPVILLTGRNDQALALSATQMGAHSYLLKDEIIEHLEDAVREVCRADVPVAIQTMAVGTEPATKPKFVDTAEGFYRSLVEAMGDGCLVIDPGGVVTFSNPALGELLGESAQSLLGRELSGLFGQAAESDMRAAIDRLSAATAPQSIICRAELGADPARTNAPSSLRVSLRSMHAADGRFTGSVVVVSDISILV